jgi:hypothetical protein
MNIKKILALLLALVLVLSLAACGGDAGNDTQKPDNSGNSAQQGGNDNPGNAGGETEAQQDDTQQIGNDYPVLKEITVEALANYPVAPEGDFLYDISDSGNGIRVHTYTGTNEIVVIPDTIDGKVVEQIASYTFANESTVKAVVIPETVTALNEVFINNVCVEVVVAKGVTKVEYAAFCNCAALNCIVLSDSLTTIGESAFAACAELTELHIPATMTEMDEYAQAMAFFYCSKLTIYGEAGSFIETVCNEQGIPFVAE